VTRESRLRAAAAACALSVLAGCSGVKPGSTPKATFEAVKRAIVTEDYEGLWGLLTSQARDEEACRIRSVQALIEAEIARLTDREKADVIRRLGVPPAEFVNMSPQKVFAEEARRGGMFTVTATLAGEQEVGFRRLPRTVRDLYEPLRDAAVTDSRTDDGRAVLTVSLGGGGTARLVLEKEHGAWRLPGAAEFISAFLPAEGLRRPGRSPKETCEAVVACMRDHAFADVWDLLSPGLRAEKTETLRRLRERFKTLSGDAIRRIERAYGVPVEEIDGLSDRELFGLNLRARIEKRDPPFVFAAIVTGRFAGQTVLGDAAAVRMEGPVGPVDVKMTLHEGRWHLAELE
jgi:hypothetical protein